MPSDFVMGAIQCMKGAKGTKRLVFFVAGLVFLLAACSSRGLTSTSILTTIPETQSASPHVPTQSAQAIPSTPTAKRMQTTTSTSQLLGTSVHVCCAPEPQHPQVDACAEAGGGVTTLLRNYGTWQGFYAFKCICTGSSLTFGNNWICNQWYAWPVNPPSWITTPLGTLVGTLQPLVLSTPVQISTPTP